MKQCPDCKVQSSSRLSVLLYHKTTSIKSHYPVSTVSGHQSQTENQKVRTHKRNAIRTQQQILCFCCARVITRGSINPSPTVTLCANKKGQRRPNYCSPQSFPLCIYKLQRCCIFLSRARQIFNFEVTVKEVCRRCPQWRNSHSEVAKDMLA